MLGLKLLWAFLAGQLFAAIMNRQMLVQICLLGEALVAAWLRANEWSFLSVHSEMIEEVMPLAEKHLAVVKIALQYFHLSLGSWILILQNPEFSRRWDLLFYLD